MSTPRIEISLGKIAHNGSALRELYAAKGIHICAVTKAVCGHPAIAEVLVNCGIGMLADSRMANIHRMRDAGIKAQFLLLRTPFLSQAEAVVTFTDLSLNSDLSVMAKLSEFALKQNTRHKVILMVELGDLREGIMPLDMPETVAQVLKLEGIQLAGIGTNLACFGGIEPDQAKMGALSLLARNIEADFGLVLAHVSGGNSANYSWFITTPEVGRINNLRLGESIFLGRETLQRQAIPGLFTDAFKLVAEVIEAKIKPSLPHGKVAQNAAGEVPCYPDLGEMRRVILGIGRQDVLVSGLTPRAAVGILGASSDHIILNARKRNYVAGDEVDFDLNYGALTSAMASPYVEKMVL